MEKEKESREAVAVDPVEAGGKTDKELVNHLAAKGGDGRLVKVDVDYTKEVDAAMLIAEKLCKEENLHGAIDALMPLEKKSRLAYDIKSNSRIQLKIIEMSYGRQEWDTLCEMILTLVKKRLAIKMSLAKMIKTACTLIDKMPNEEVKYKLIETLRTATAGKIYVEVERARLTQQLAEKKWAEGKQKEAAEMMLELHVETYTTMDVKERIRFLCEQMRMALAIGDVTRAAGTGKKVSVRFFHKHAQETSVQALKVMYYKLLIEIGLLRGEFADVSLYYRELFSTPILSAVSEQVTSALRASSLYCLLSPHSPEQLSHIRWLLSELDYEPDYKKLVSKFLVHELISWNDDIKANYEKMLFQDSAEGKGVGVFMANEEGNARWKTLRTRVAEHNMRIMSKYYSRITLDRIASLLEMQIEEAEDFVCRVACEWGISGRIHRPSRVVSLAGSQSTLSRLDSWADALNRLHDHINKASHLINKEQTVHSTLFSYSPMTLRPPLLPPPQDKQSSTESAEQNETNPSDGGAAPTAPSEQAGGASDEQKKN